MAVVFQKTSCTTSWIRDHCLAAHFKTSARGTWHSQASTQVVVGVILLNWAVWRSHKWQEQETNSWRSDDNAGSRGNNLRPLVPIQVSSAIPAEESAMHWSNWYVIPGTIHIKFWISTKQGTTIILRDKQIHTTKQISILKIIPKITFKKKSD